VGAVRLRTRVRRPASTPARSGHHAQNIQNDIPRIILLVGWRGFYGWGNGCHGLHHASSALSA
jgi:hypothetical protein